MTILPEESFFFAALGEQLGVAPAALLAAVAEQVAKASAARRACVELDGQGHVRALDLFDFPELGFRLEPLSLDCSPLARLERLRVFNLDLRLEVSQNPALESLEIPFCRQQRLDLPRQLEHLDCTGNPVAELDLARLPHLRTLKCGYTPLEAIDVSGLRHLERLECGWNDNSYYREGWSGPRLKTLVLGTHPALKHLVLQNWLYRGTPEGERLQALDLRGLPALEHLDLTQCRLRSLDLSQNPALKVLACSGNPLERLDLQQNPALEYLSLDGTALESVDVSKHPALKSLVCGGPRLTALALTGARALATLRCSGAALTTLDLSDNPNLETLALTKCRLERLDLTPCGRLREVTLSGCRTLREIQCGDAQRETVVGLRKFFKLAKATSDPSKMDAFALHHFVDHYNWDDGVAKLRKAIRSPRCSLATALLTYWRASPHYYLRYADDAAALADVTGAQVIPLIREIERRALQGLYQHHEKIAWEAQDLAKDPDPEVEKKSAIPSHMIELSRTEWRAR